jgi:hypothetical protein
VGAASAGAAVSASRQLPTTRTAARPEQRPEAASEAALRAGAGPGYGVDREEGDRRTAESPTREKICGEGGEVELLPQPGGSAGSDYPPVSGRTHPLLTRPTNRSSGVRKRWGRITSLPTTQERGWLLR